MKKFLSTLLFLLVILGFSPSISFSGSMLSFDVQTGSFTVTNILNGAISGATATISAVQDNGTTGTLQLTNIVGTFENDEIIYEAALGGELAESDFSDASWNASNLTVVDANTLTLDAVNGYIYSDNIAVLALNHYVVSFTPTLGTVTAPNNAMYNITTPGFIFIDEVMLDGIQNNIYFTTPALCIAIRAYGVRHAGSTGTMDLDNFSIKPVTNAALANGIVSESSTSGGGIGTISGE